MTRRWLIALVVVLPLIWAILRFGLRPDLGLDLTDEGLYLLEADPPTPTANWATPYGWHTGPLFRLVGYDVAAFRSWGAWLLLLAVALLGIAALSFGEHRRTAHPPASGMAARLPGGVIPAMAGVVGVLGGSLYYAGMVRTPSYNWLTIFGAVVATIGALHLLGLGRDPWLVDERRTAGAQVHLWAATIAVGLFISLPAKPTTPVFFVVLFTPAALRVLGGRRSLRAALLIAGYALALLGLALATRLWPLGFPEVFLRALQTPTPSETQSLWGAVQEFVLLPVRAVQVQPLVAALMVIPAVRILERRAIPMRWRWRILGAALSISAAWLLVVPPLLRWAYDQAWTDSFVMRGRATIPIDTYLGSTAGLRLGLPLLLLCFLAILWPGIGAREKRRAVQLVLLALAVIVIEPQGSVLFGGPGRTRWVNAELTTSLLLVFGGLLVSFAPEGRRDRRGESIGSEVLTSDPGTHRLVAATLVVLAFATGFGSAHLPYRQASLAAALLVTASLVLVAGFRDRIEQSYALLTVLAPVALLSAVIWADNQAHPYRTAPMAEQDIATPVGTEGALLFLDQDRHRLLTDLERTAGDAGWQPGDRLFGLAAPWSSTIPWHLGATVPDSIMPTLRTNQERLAFNLTWWDLDGWDDAWMLTTPEAAGPDLHRRTMEQAGQVAAAVGRSFPSDYTSVWVQVDPEDEFANYELWRPNP